MTDSPSGASSSEPEALPVDKRIPLGGGPRLFVGRTRANGQHEAVCQKCGRVFARANSAHGLAHEQRGEARRFLLTRYSDRWTFEMVKP